MRHVSPEQPGTIWHDRPVTRSTAHPASRLALRVALLVGTADATVALVSALVAGSSAATVLLAVAWCGAWMTAALAWRRVASVVRARPWVVPALGVVAFVPALADGGYPGVLATQPIWLVLVAAATLPRRWVVVTGIAVFAAKAGVFAATSSGPPPLGTSEAREARTAVLLPLLLVPIGLIGHAVLERLAPLLAPGSPNALVPAAAAGEPGEVPPALATPAANGSRSTAAAPAPTTSAPSRDAPALPLTAAQREIVTLLAAGLVPKQIATARGTTLATVRTQIKHAKRRTGSRTLDELVATAAERP